MSYRYSTLDKNNIDWFNNDPSNASLMGIYITHGEIRGLKNITIDFKYPITAIAGRNGSGKSTVLALAACAFHNENDGFRLPHRKHSYYTFADFFVQSSEEIPIGGIAIYYSIFYNKWRPSERLPNGIGIGTQLRWKNPGGKWNDYSRRATRTVVFLGINRVVPHAEKSVSKSYKSYFKSAESAGWEEDVREVVGRIIGRDYSRFEFRRAFKYRLPLVGHRDAIYSGFNMGAGEDALFEVISTIFECPEGSLIVIDEIELGLHEEAQTRFINELKNLCKERKIQVICTTHSPRILECLPPEARIFLERNGDLTKVMPGISPAYATGKLSGIPKKELDILVEDDVAALIVQTALSNEIRMRVNVLPMGSAAAVMRALAVHYVEKRKTEVCVILDGDKKSSKTSKINAFLDALEKAELRDKGQEWVEKRLSFLPGDEWPEKWVLSQRSEIISERLKNDFGIDSSRVEDILESALKAGKHKEFYEAASLLNFDKGVVSYSLVCSSLETCQDEKEKIVKFISAFLE